MTSITANRATFKETVAEMTEITDNTVRRASQFRTPLNKRNVVRLTRNKDKRHLVQATQTTVQDESYHTPVRSLPERPTPLKPKPSGFIKALRQSTAAMKQDAAFMKSEVDRLKLEKEVLELKLQNKTLEDKVSKQSVVVHRSDKPKASSAIENTKGIVSIAGGILTVATSVLQLYAKAKKK
jgi:hypothetical protein